MLCHLRRKLAFTLLIAGPVCLAACGDRGQPDKGSPSSEGAPTHLEGSWAVLRVDEGRVAPDSFRVDLRRAEVTGGHDGCNNWGYDEGLPTLPGGGRMIVSDAQGCPETPQSRAYRLVVASPAITPLASDRLLLTGGGHRLLVERCEWVTVREERAGYSSQKRSCRTARPQSA